MPKWTERRDRERKGKEYLALFSHLYSVLYTLSFTVSHDVFHLFVWTKCSLCLSKAWDTITLEGDLECRPCLLSLINNTAAWAKGLTSCLQQLPAVEGYNRVQETDPYWEILSLVFPFPPSANQESTDWGFNISSFPEKDILSDPQKQMNVKVRDKEKRHGSKQQVARYHRIPDWNRPQGSSGPSFLGKHDEH